MFIVTFDNNGRTQTLEFARWEYACAFARRFGFLRKVWGQKEPVFVPGTITDLRGKYCPDLGLAN